MLRALGVCVCWLAQRRNKLLNGSLKISLVDPVLNSLVLLKRILVLVGGEANGTAS